jgi:sugar phosphate isomerase/epimerase
MNQPIVRTIDALRQGQVTAVELGTPPHHFNPWQRDQVEDLGHHLRQWSVTPIAIHAPFGGLLDLTDSNPHHRYAAIGAILTAASALRKLGGTYVVVHVSDVPRANQNVGERLAHGTQALRVLAEACEHMRATLVVETPLPHLIGGHPDEFASVIDALDRSVGVCFDTSHVTLGHHWDRFMDLVGERLMHVHANDHRGRYDDHLPPGEGIIDWTHIRDTLQQANFHGWIVLELVSSIESLPTFISTAMRRAQELLLR